MRLLRRLDYDGIRLYRPTTAIMRSHGGVLSGVTSLAQRRCSPRRFQNLYHVASVTSIWYTPKCNPMYYARGAHQLGSRSLLCTARLQDVVLRIASRPPKYGPCLPTTSGHGCQSRKRVAKSCSFVSRLAGLHRTLASGIGVITRAPFRCLLLVVLVPYPGASRMFHMAKATVNVAKCIASFHPYGVLVLSSHRPALD